MDLNHYFAKNTYQIFIIPTRYGILYTLVTAIALLSSAYYLSDVGYLLTFFLVVVGIIAMVATHNNIKHLKFDHLRIKPAPAGGECQFQALIRNLAAEPKFNIQIRLMLADNSKQQFSFKLAESKSSHLITNHFKAGLRGGYLVEAVRLSTVYPLGLFYAWMYCPCDADYYVYPQPYGDKLYRWNQEKSKDAPITNLNPGTSDFSEHRKYQKSDSIRHIDWKAYARTQKLLVKSFNEGGGEVPIYRLHELSEDNKEEVLSQVSKWIHDSHRKKETYGLEVEGKKLPPASGERHFFSCLKLLALLPKDEKQA